MAVVLLGKVQHRLGLSSDSKPTVGVPAGSEFYETDTTAKYIFDGTAWHFKPDGRYLRATKTLTFTGAAGLGAVGSATFFTVTGEVVIRYIVPFCTVLLAEAAPTATIALGVTGATTIFVAATNAVDIDANEFWVDTAPDGNGVDLPDSVMDKAITDDIIATIGAQNVTSGAIRIDLWWLPLSANGLIVPA